VSRGYLTSIRRASLKSSRRPPSRIDTFRMSRHTWMSAAAFV
jgi:hypothetical protein